MLRVMIIGIDELLRGALATLLAHEPDLGVVAELVPDDDACAAARLLRVDVAVLDLDGQEEEGLDTARRLSDGTPDCPVLALTGRPAPDVLRQALSVRVRGLLGKDTVPGELAWSVRRVAGGERVLDPVLATAVLRPASNPLTDRERTVLRLAAEGLPSSEIAQGLHLAEGTVRNYLSNAIRKTVARNRLEAVRRAKDAGWL